MTDINCIIAPEPNTPEAINHSHEKDISAMPAFMGLAQFVAKDSIEEANKRISDAIEKIQNANKKYETICSDFDKSMANLTLLSGALMIISAATPVTPTGIILGKTADALGHVATAMGFNQDIQEAKNTCKKIYQERFNDQDLNKARYDYEDAVKTKKGITAYYKHDRSAYQVHLHDWDKYIYDWELYRHKLDITYPRPTVKVRAFTPAKELSQRELQSCAAYFKHFIG